MDENTLDAQFIKEGNIRPNAKRAKMAQTLIWIVMVFDIIAAVSSYMQYNLLQALQNFEMVPDETLEANDTREQMIGLLYLVVFIISTITFIQWFRRAYYNLNLRTNCSHAEGWAAGSWFVPIISLFRPYQIMKEMWVKTTGLINSKTESSTGHENTSVIGWWWALWIISNFIGNYVAKGSFKAETIDNFINITLTDMVMSLIGIPLAIITVKMIKSYSIKEEKLSEIELKSVEILIE